MEAARKAWISFHTSPHKIQLSPLKPSKRTLSLILYRKRFVWTPNSGFLMFRGIFLYIYCIFFFHFSFFIFCLRRFDAVSNLINTSCMWIPEHTSGFLSLAFFFLHFLELLWGQSTAAIGIGMTGTTKSASQRWWLKANPQTTFYKTDNSLHNFMSWNWQDRIHSQN